MTATLQAPFPWFGGKSRVADLVWQRLGEVRNYVEPFFGSGAVLLGRPHLFGTETVNDLDGYVANFWRSIKLSPEQTAEHADNPVNENDLHARHIWLVQQRDDLRARLEGDPDFHDPRIAGYWAWGISCWIGSGFCSGDGPWQSVNRSLVHLGDKGQGVNRSLVHLGNKGQGLLNWFHALACRLRRVRVCSGDWSRVCSPSVTTSHGLTAVFLDPPYADTASRHSDLYAEDSLSVAHDVRDWAVSVGDDKLMRVALCGYEGEHEMPKSWDCVAWKASGGYESQSSCRSENCKRERIWFSPHCISESGQMGLFK